MSIAGIWARSPSAAEGGLERLLFALPNRTHSVAKRLAPDEAVRLGYLPVLALPEFCSDPAADTRLQLAITGDVRLDNRPELLLKLGIRDERLSDNALILEAYARWQDDCVAQLLGDFTFVIHDYSRKRLFAARDVAGSHALYYAVFGGIFAFASNPGALLALPELPRELDQRAVVDYLGDFTEDDQATLIRAIRRLPPGAHLSYRASSVTVSQYFDVRSIPERCLSSDEEYAEALREALTRAVACRLPKTGRCGVMLSGGLDSSMVTALAARASKSPLGTFSAVFDDIPECDERVFQGPVVRAAKTEHYEVRPEPSGASADLELLFHTFGEPIPIGPHWLAWAVGEAAAARGMNVLLTGVDGDRVVSHGTGRTAELAYQHRWRDLVREVRAVPDFSPLRRARVLAVHALLPVVPERFRLFLEQRDPRRRLALSAALRLLRPEAVRAAGVEERLVRAMRRPLNTREAHEQILTSPNRGRDVELLDRLSGTLGIEFRHPFFDRRVVELCLSFPGEQKRQKGRPRYVLRNAMAGLVPDAVRLRPRDTYFDAAFAAWTRPWALAQACGAPLNLDNLHAFVDLEALLPVWKHFSGPPARAAAWPVDVARRCVVLSRWLDSIGAAKSASP
jgi:asparagine synthase (glutamine-hydrolysing)